MKTPALIPFFKDVKYVKSTSISMDRTTEFFEAVKVLNYTESAKLTLPSSFLIKAADMFQQMNAFEKLLDSCFDSYVNYHRYLPSKDLSHIKCMSPDDRQHFSKEVALFIASLTSEIQSLNHQVDRLSENMLSYSNEYGNDVNAESSQVAFYKLILSSLLTKLSTFTIQSEKMEREYLSQTLNPYRLLSGCYISRMHDYESDDSSHINESFEMPLFTPSTSVATLFSTLTSSFTNTSAPREIKKDDESPLRSGSTAHVVPAIKSSSSNSHQQQSFAQRYIDEIAPASKLKEYTAIAVKHKEVLFKEARILKARFSDDMLESHKMERTVMDISSMLSEFSNLIESQSEIVDTIGEVSRDATDSISQTDKELLLTLQRTQSHQWTMIVFILGMAIMLLFLDVISQ